jgi:hypothetical protein
MNNNQIMNEEPNECTKIPRSKIKSLKQNCEGARIKKKYLNWTAIIKRRKITGENTILNNASFKMRDLDSNAICTRRKMKSREKNWKAERNWNEQKSNQGRRTERIKENQSKQNQILQEELRKRTNLDEISKLNNDN